jgi:protoporphyrinogen oxidase
MKNKNIIIGAGLTGLSASLNYGRNNCLVLEKDARPGGLCKSEKDNGFTYDYTGHLLHLRDPYVKSLVMELLGDNFVTRNRDACIYSSGVFTRYPFQANLFGLPQKIVDECIRGFVESKLLYNREKKPDISKISFRDWCLRTLGKGISRHFMLPYNTKLWQTDPALLTTKWIGRYVPQPTLQEVISGAGHDSTKRVGYNAFFYYPERGGIGAFTDAVTKRAGEIRTGVKISEISLKGKFVIVGGEKIYYDKIVSTMPLPELLSVVSDLPSAIRGLGKKLNWTSVLNINIGVNRKGISKSHWVYFPEKKFPFYRAGFYGNFSGRLCPSGTSSMYIEIAYKNRRIDAEKSYENAIRGLIESGILKRGDKIVSKCILDIPFGYVIYDADRETALQPILKFLKKNSVLSTGRYGGWKYSTMEDAILDGREAAQWMKK